MAYSVKVLSAALTATGGGTTDFTSSGFGTPDAAIVFISAANATNNPEAQAQISVGFWDGTSQLARGATALDATASSNVGARAYSATRIGKITAGNSTTVTCGYTASSITDGIRLTLSDDATSVERYATVILFQGLTSAKAGEFTFSGTSAIDVTAPGFQPDMVFYCTTSVVAADSADHFIMAFGVATNSGSIVQNCVSLAHSDAATGIVNSSVNDNAICRVVLNDGSIINRTETISAFDASGFTITPSTSSSSVPMYLALKLDDPADAYVGIKDSATGTGDAAVTGLGFTPVVLGIVGSTHTATNSTTTAPDSSISYCATDGTTSQSLIVGVEDALSTSNANSRRTTDALNLRFDDDTVDAVASFVSFDADGYTLNYSDASASARKMLVWAIGTSGGPTYTLTADSGSIAITGTAASLKFNRSLSAGVGAFNITGTDAALKFNRVLVADGGSIAVTGTDATLTYSGAGAPTYTLTAEGGSVAITGTAASLKFNRLLACDAGSIVITGAAATLTYSGASGFTVDQLAYLDAKFAAVLAAIPSAATTATAVLAAAATTPIQADVRKVVGITVDGTGTDGDPWGPA